MTPFEQMQAFNREFSDSKAIYRQMQLWQLKNTPDNGVFFPSGNLYHVSPRLMAAVMAGKIGHTKVDDMSAEQLTLLRYFWGLHTFGAWRNTLGIYRIDRDVFSQIIKSPIPDDTPSTVFERLPEWCVYIDMPNKAMGVTTGSGREAVIAGFWALFDIQNVDGKQQRVLNLVLDIDNDVKTTHDAYQPMLVPIHDDMTVRQAILSVFDSDMHQVNDALVSRANAETEINIITHLLSLLLWLCAEEPDISNIKGEPISGNQLRMPKYRTNKKTGVFVPPSQPIIYNIGKRLGGEVRQFNAKTGASDSRISACKRPHIRRGHWHGVWSGKDQNKQFNIYWQPAIFVNAK